MPPEDNAARTFRHLVQQRDAKCAEMARLMSDVVGINAALADLLDGNGAKAAHIDLISRLGSPPPFAVGP